MEPGGQKKSSLLHLYKHSDTPKCTPGGFRPPTAGAFLPQDTEILLSNISLIPSGKESFFCCCLGGMLQNIRGNLVWRAPAAFFFHTLRSIVCSPHLVSEAPEVSSVRADKTLMQDPFPPPPRRRCLQRPNKLRAFLYVRTSFPPLVCLLCPINDARGIWRSGRKGEMGL